jgi:hypothetical protein
MSVFETTAYMATCDGMKFYLKVWSGLTSRQQDNLLDFIKDPTLIGHKTKLIKMFVECFVMNTAVI